MHKTRTAVALGREMSHCSFYWKTKGNYSERLRHHALDHDTKTLTATSVTEAANVTIPQPLVALTFRSPIIHVAFFQKLSQYNGRLWIGSLDGSYYFTGIRVQQFSSLCLMANDPVIVVKDVSLLRRCVTKVETANFSFHR
ncbi:hypothetical protein PsorP6_005287 [Peronosclerospora sorghi]|uniref:Uncharacterized protein n=1 Tax=Peronosclerospora sorghi TaxID=230839 RepID=A0ACC0W6S1_9STRA|nr:hypothetical protein PsorP6_005287 [Peronosclerospora sorghi]